MALLALAGAIYSGGESPMRSMLAYEMEFQKSILTVERN
jgi:hypothetical protein